MPLLMILAENRFMFAWTLAISMSIEPELSMAKMMSAGCFLFVAVSLTVPATKAA